MFAILLIGLRNSSLRRSAASGAAACLGLWLSAAGCTDSAPRLGAGQYMGERVTATPADPLNPEPPADQIESTEHAVCPTRSDLAPIAPNPIIGEGPFGRWETCFHFCPEGTFAYGLRLKSEPEQGPGDDTALNGVKLRCWNPTTHAFGGEVAAAESPWGGFLQFAECGPWEEPLAGGKMRIEASQGAGDDTTANELIGWCHAPDVNSGPLIFPPTNTHWGSLTSIKSCPIGSAVCGVRSKLESGRGAGDDTALNGVQFSCCTFPLE